MKRVDLTPEQLEDVIRYRQGGLSWLGIQNATGISRRVAQRSFEKWQKARSIRELENVRVKAGEAEFERHLDALTRWAESLVDYLSLPEYPGFSMDAGTYFFSLMEKDIAEPPAEVAATAREDRARARNIRRNKLLFESLKEHTADKIRWDLLTGWMEGWDSCYRVFPGLMTLAGEVTGTAFNRFPGFDEWFVAGRGQSSPLEILKEGILDVLWKAIVAGGVNTAADSIQSEKVELNEEEILRITVGLRNLFQRDNREMDPSVTSYCRGVIDELWNSGEAREMRSAVERMRGVVEELEAVLEPLVLRPLILRTRCKICPA